MPYKRIRERTDATILATLLKHDGEDGCWDYTGRGRRAGYGFLHRRDEECFIHRRAWIQATGETLTGKDVILHTCDRRICCRNDTEGTYEVDGVAYPRRGHLFKATRSVNSADKVAKNRQARGTKTGLSKLTETQVLAIRATIERGGISQRQLAFAYGISPMAVSQIVRRKSWTHI